MVSGMLNELMNLIPLLGRQLRVSTSPLWLLLKKNIVKMRPSALPCVPLVEMNGNMKGSKQKLIQGGAYCQVGHQKPMDTPADTSSLAHKLMSVEDTETI